MWTAHSAQGINCSITVTIVSDQEPDNIFINVNKKEGSKESSAHFNLERLTKTISSDITISPTAKISTTVILDNIEIRIQSC
jgi:hypothetical protein